MTTQRRPIPPRHIRGPRTTTGSSRRAFDDGSYGPLYDTTPYDGSSTDSCPADTSAGGSDTSGCGSD